MRIHVSFIDRVGITQEVLALLGGRNLNLDAVEMVPPNVYIDAPTLSPEVLEELRAALLGIRGVQAMTVVDILPGQRRRLQLDALLAAMADPVLAVDGKGLVLLANPASVSYTHLRAHETGRNLVCRLLLEKKKKKKQEIET